MLSPKETPMEAEWKLRVVYYDPRRSCNVVHRDKRSGV